MAERWSFEAGLGSGSETKTSSGRAGSSGFSEVGKRPGGMTAGGVPGRGTVRVQSQDSYITGMLRGVPPERQLEVLRREGQRLTDVSAHHDGEIRARRAEGYLNEDPKVQGWLHLIRGTDAELARNGGKARAGSLNDRVQRIQTALGAPLGLTPQPGGQPAGMGPPAPKQYPPPGVPRGDTSAGTRPGQPREEQRTRNPVQTAQGRETLASQPGGQPSTPPRQQPVVFREREARPAAPGVKPGRQEGRGPGGHPLVAMNLSQLLGTFKGPPQIGVGVTPGPERGVALTIEDVVKRAREIAQPSAGPAPMRVPPAKPGQAPTVNQLIQEFTGTPYGPTGEQARQVHNARLKDPAYRFAGPDTFNPATWEVHRKRTDQELNFAYALATLMPIMQATLEKQSARHSAKEKRGEVAPPPLLDIDVKRRQQQLDEIRQLRPIIEAYTSPIGEEMETKQVRLNYAQRSDMGQPIPAIRQEAERYRQASERITQEALQQLSREEMRKAAYRSGVQLTRFQKEIIDSVSDYKQLSLLTSQEVTSAMGADLALNFLAGKVGGWAAVKLAARFPWLASAGAKLATKLGMEEAAAVEAKSGALTTLKRGANEVVKRVRPGEREVASGIAGSIQQPLTYALSEDHPTAGRLIQEAAVGLGGGLVGDRVFAGAVRGLGVPGRWLAQWAEKHPSVEEVRRVLGLIGSGDIQFREGALGPEFSPRARQALGGGVKLADVTSRPALAPGVVREGRALAAPGLPGREGQPHAGSGPRANGERPSGRESEALAGTPTVPVTPVPGGVTGPAKAPGPRPAAASPEPAPPPKGAPSHPEIPTAPAQMPGAVAVSGEPDFSVSVLQGLARARNAAALRIAVRRPRKGPVRMPRGRNGMRPGMVIGPGVVVDELGDLLDYALIGATHLAEGAWDRSVWDRRMVKRVGKQIEPYLEQIRELSRRIHQGWKDYRIPTEGTRVRESARTYLQKLAAEAAPAAAASRGTSPPGKATTSVSSDAFVLDPNLTREGKLPPLVEKAHQAALEQLRSGPGQWQYGLPDAQSLKLYGQAGATYLAKGFGKQAWKERMLADLGGDVEPILDWLWQYTEGRYNSHYKGHWKESWNTPLGADPPVPSGGAARPTTQPEIALSSGKAAPSGTAVRPLGRPLSSDKGEVTRWKRQMKARKYPREEVEAGIERYFGPVREQYADLKGKDNIFIPMPSTTGKNIIPKALARRLSEEFGGEVLSGEHIRPLHTEERKLLDVYERFIEPAEYEVMADLSRLAGKNVVIVDDLLTSGDSTEGLRYALRQQGIAQTDVVTLASNSQTATSSELAELSAEVARRAKVPEAEVRKLVEAQLKHAPQRLVKGLLKKAEDPDHAEYAEAIHRRLTGKRTGVPGNGR